MYHARVTERFRDPMSGAHATRTWPLVLGRRCGAGEGNRTLMASWEGWAAVPPDLPVELRLNRSSTSISMVRSEPLLTSIFRSFGHVVGTNLRCVSFVGTCKLSSLRRVAFDRNPYRSVDLGRTAFVAGTLDATRRRGSRHAWPTAFIHSWQMATERGSFRRLRGHTITVTE